MKSFIGVMVVSALLLASRTMGASREQQEMQRDIAQLGEQVRGLQSSLDKTTATLQTLMQQSLDTGNRTNTTVSVLSSSVVDTIDRELKDRMAPLAGTVAGLTSRMDNISNDLAEVKNSTAALTAQLNRLAQQLNDINNAVKVIGVAPAPPPPANTNSESALPPAVSAPRVAGPPAKTLWDNAYADYSSGKADLAASEFADFVRFYPDDPFAPSAQYYVGQVHLSQGKFDQAVMDFDAVLERFPEGKITPDAYFMKGMALKQGGHRDAAATEWRALIRKFPRSDRAPQAQEQLRALGLSPSTPVGRLKK